MVQKCSLNNQKLSEAIQRRKAFTEMLFYKVHMIAKDIVGVGATEEGLQGFLLPLGTTVNGIVFLVFLPDTLLLLNRKAMDFLC